MVPAYHSQVTSSRQTPLYEVHARLGAVMTSFAGWQMPLRYGSETAEHQAVRHAAGLFDLSHMGEIMVRGSGAGAALDYALTGFLSAVERRRIYAWPSSAMAKLSTSSSTWLWSGSSMTRKSWSLASAMGCVSRSSPRLTDLSWRAGAAGGSSRR